MPQRDSTAPEADIDRGVYTMSVATDMTGMHAQTLRKYEREGLLEPARSRGGSRRFSARDVGRLRHIARLASDGVNVEGIRRILVMEARIERLEARVEGLEHALALAGSSQKTTKRDRASTRGART